VARCRVFDFFGDNCNEVPTPDEDEDVVQRLSVGRRASSSSLTFSAADAGALFPSTEPTWLSGWRAFCISASSAFLPASSPNEVTSCLCAVGGYPLGVYWVPLSL
jgi:hypothetical protein